jgi:hypothetical protein
MNDQTQTSGQSGGAATTSVLAIVAAGCSLLSVMVCIGAVVAATLIDPGWGAMMIGLPLLGLAGAICGGAALVRIHRAQGALLGRNAALIGLFIGLMSAVVQGAVVGGALATFGAISKHVVPAVTTMAREASAGNADAAAALLSDGARQIAGPARLTEFFGALEAEHGAMVRVSFGLGTIGAARRVTANATGAPTAAVQAQSPRPVEVAFQNGWTLLYVYVDDAALDQNQVRVMDLLAVDKDGTARALLPDGPGRVLAQAIGLKLE